MGLRIDTPADLGAAVRRARRAQRMRQEDVALVSGAGVRFVGDLERGKSTLQLGKTLRVLAALGLKLDLDEGPADGRA